MKVYVLYSHPTKDTEFVLGLYANEDDLKHDIDILNRIDKLQFELRNKEICPNNQDQSIIHYTWTTKEVASSKKKGE